MGQPGPLGVLFSDRTVSMVTSGLQADQLGIRVGWVISEVDNRRWSRSMEIKEIFKKNISAKKTTNIIFDVRPLSAPEKEWVACEDVEIRTECSLDSEMKKEKLKKSTRFVGTKSGDWVKHLKGCSPISMKGVKMLARIFTEAEKREI